MSMVLLFLQVGLTANVKLHFLFNKGVKFHLDCNLFVSKQ